MRYLSTTLAVALLLVICASASLGAETSFSAPILLTSCGQSADVLMMKTLLAKDSLAFSYLPGATASDVAGKGSVILVVGGSGKGLGAAKISAEDETARVQGLLDAAHKAGIPVLAVHMGGTNRRGALSDPFNKLGAENAERLIVVRGGNEDGFFTKIAEEKAIEMDTVRTALEVNPLLMKLFGAAK
jgi:hypothetical protein